MTIFLFCLVLVLTGTNVYTVLAFRKVRSQLEATKVELGSTNQKMIEERDKCICRNL